MNKLAWLGVACALVACTKAEFDAGNAKVSEGAAVAVRPTMVAPPGVLERRVLDLAPCTLEGTQITSMCPAMQALSRELAQTGKRTLSADAAARLLAHASPAVRVEAGALSANLTIVADAAHREHDPIVRQALVKLLAGDAGIASFATDPAVAVRREVVGALATRVVPGGSAALGHIIETDADAAVRADACRLAGNLVDESLLPLYERMTATASDLRDACMEGLSAMVLDNEAAYRLFLRRISEGVRPWQAMSAFCPYKAAKRPAWFSVDEVRGVLAKVIEDRTTPPMAVAAARESLETLSL